MFEVKLRNCWLSTMAEDSSGLFFFPLEQKYARESRRKRENEEGILLFGYNAL